MVIDSIHYQACVVHASRRHDGMTLVGIERDTPVSLGYVRVLDRPSAVSYRVRSKKTGTEGKQTCHPNHSFIKTEQELLGSPPPPTPMPPVGRNT